MTDRYASLSNGEDVHHTARNSLYTLYTLDTVCIYTIYSVYIHCINCTPRERSAIVHKRSVEIESLETPAL